MKSIQHWGIIMFSFWLMAILPIGHAAAAFSDGPPVITSLALAGTNLVFTAVFPAGVDQAILEMRPTLAAAWQEATRLDVSTNGGGLTFSIPQPAVDTAFFRLNVTLRATSQPELSSEVHYVVVPSLAQYAATNGLTNEALFYFKGQIDGSDRIVITRQGAFWEHVNWGWPGTVLANDAQWTPSDKNYLTTTGAVAFLPDKYSLATVRLDVLQGRDIIALERTNNALIVYLNDTPLGDGPYEFKLHFLPPADAHTNPSPAATLKIAAQIDGSDRLKITTNAATWTHLAYAPPWAVKVNDMDWDLARTNVLANSGTNAFLPAGIDFSTARIVHRQGRDLATVWAEADALWVTFADNPNGDDAYELEISFGSE